ncbi:TRADD-N-associated membrane domain-containing protein [Streptomyces goshikiensis]
MSIDPEAILAVVATVLGAATSVLASQQLVSRLLKKESDVESKRLRGIIHVHQSSDQIHLPAQVHEHEEPTQEVGREPIPPAGMQRIDDDKFAELLIEYYAWGLTQARRSTALSLTCSGLGIFVILGGVALGIWRAESSGDLYASAATSAAGVVSTVIGHLAHRRADAALKHMQGQTESLRQDMQREREVEASIRLLSEVDDLALRSHLQAALVLKLAGAELPVLPDRGLVPSKPRSSRNGAAAV